MPLMHNTYSDSVMKMLFTAPALELDQAGSRYLTAGFMQLTPQLLMPSGPCLDDSSFSQIMGSSSCGRGTRIC